MRACISDSWQGSEKEKQNVEDVLKFLDGFGLIGHDVPMRAAEAPLEIRAWLANKDSLLPVLQVSRISFGTVRVQFSSKFSDHSCKTREAMQGYVPRVSIS